MWSAQEKAAVQSMLGLLVTGSIKTVREKLDAFIEKTGADELIMTSDPYDSSDRLKSFSLIAEAKAL